MAQKISVESLKEIRKEPRAMRGERARLTQTIIRCRAAERSTRQRRSIDAARNKRNPTASSAYRGNAREREKFIHHKQIINVTNKMSLGCQGGNSRLALNFAAADGAFNDRAFPVAAAWPKTVIIHYPFQLQCVSLIAFRRQLKTFLHLSSPEP